MEHWENQQYLAYIVQVFQYWANIWQILYKYFVNIAQIKNLEIEHIAQILCGGSRTNEIVFL